MEELEPAYAAIIAYMCISLFVDTIQIEIRVISRMKIKAFNIFEDINDVLGNFKGRSGNVK